MNREYDLPAATNAPQPQAEFAGTLAQHHDVSRWWADERLPTAGWLVLGQRNYQGGGTYMDGGYQGDGYGPDGYGMDGGYGDDGFYDDGGPATYDEYGRPLYLTPCPYCGECCGGISCHHRWLDESSVFAGVHAFKGGLDQGQNGNFGFQEGVNFAGALWHRYGIGYQVGAQFVQSDLSGTNIANAFNNSRQQNFLTVGLFHRPQCGRGLQGGAVYDWLDDRFYTRARFEQIRGEISYIFGGGNEFGYWGSFVTGANQTQTVNGALLNFNAVNLNAFFYRKNFANGDQGRILGWLHRQLGRAGRCRLPRPHVEPVGSDRRVQLPDPRSRQGRRRRDARIVGPGDEYRLVPDAPGLRHPQRPIPLAFQRC